LRGEYFKLALSYSAVEESLADSLSDAIIDWRDKNESAEINGAEQSEYESANLKYSPRNDQFKSVEEVQMVLGMTAEIYKQLEAKISCHTQHHLYLFNTFKLVVAW
jgi:general secretion pathway protein K